MTNKYFILIFFILLFTKLIFSQIKLVVGIVVDQMRYDYIERFWNKFGENGFKKLINNGAFFTNAHFNYIPTYTAPGHATIFSGTTPSVHSIIGNLWYNRENKKTIYCIADDSVKTIGSNSKEGMVSAKNLSVLNLSDEIKKNNKAAKVFAISLKDRGAVLPAGHFADAAFWLDDESGNWISSSYYIRKLPDWLIKYNNTNFADKYIAKNWTTFFPISNYTESLKDNNKYERPFPSEKLPVFPHKLTEIFKYSNYGILKSTPFGNEMLELLAEKLIINENLGKDEICDLISISFSATDYVGHQFGPLSVELEDTYIRLDKNIADLISFLDKNIGNDNYIIFLTADHGAAYNPAYLIDKGENADFFSHKQLYYDLNKYLFEKFNLKNIVSKVINFQIYFNDSIIIVNKLKKYEIYSSIKEFISKNEKKIKKIYSKEEILAKNDKSDTLLNYVSNAFNSKNSGDMAFVLNKNIMDYTAQGTTHGSPYEYDTHVPLIFYGGKIKHQKINKRIYTTQIAPTVAKLIGISLNLKCTAKPIVYIFN